MSEQEVVETPPRGVRWWPLVLIGAGYAARMIYVWICDVDQRQERFTGSIIATVLAGLLTVIWLMLLSRLPWRKRLALAGGLALVGVVGAQFVEIKGFDGDFVPEVRMTGSEIPIPPPGPTVASPDVIGDTPCRNYSQFQGNRRDAVVRGTHLVDWTESPPRMVWRRAVGPGWSSFAVVGERAITQEQHGVNETVVCYELRTGRRQWVASYEALYDGKIGGTGPRATPTIDGDDVFTLGSTGVVCCVGLTDGKIRWKRDMMKTAGSKGMEWGNSCSPLIDDDRVLVHGGPKGWTLVALDRKSGRVLWHAGDQQIGHASPAKVTLAGRAQILMFNTGGISAHDPKDGTVLWTQPWPGMTQSCAQPVVIGPDRVLFSTGYGAGARVYEIKAEGEGLTSKQVWKQRLLRAKFSNLLVHGEHVYTLSDGKLSCFSLADGTRAWRGPRYGHGQLIRVGDKLIVQAEKGPVVLVQIGTTGSKELGRIEAFDSKTWNPPAFAAPLLLVRNDREAVCYRLATSPKK